MNIVEVSDIKAKRVSRQSLEKVLEFFVRHARMTGSRTVHMTLEDLADEAGVSVGTLIKAIKDLEDANLVESILEGSRRYAKTYIYKGDLDAEDLPEDDLTPSEYIAKLKRENYELHKQLDEARQYRKLAEEYLDLKSRIKSITDDGDKVILVVNKKSASDGSIVVSLR